MVLGLVGACLPISKPGPGRDIAEMEKWSRENLGPRVNLLPASHPQLRPWTAPLVFDITTP
jgi:hypothetical protein